MRKRSVARECALKILYQIEIFGATPEKVLFDFWLQESEHDQEVQDFATGIVQGIYTRLDEIDRKISDYATNWQVSRMAIIDRNVMRMGVYELLHAVDIPPKVAINEEVDLAKKYGDKESGKFVNGILDKIHKQEVNPPKA